MSEQRDPRQLLLATIRAVELKDEAMFEAATGGFHPIKDDPDSSVVFIGFEAGAGARQLVALADERLSWDDLRTLRIEPPHFPPRVARGPARSAVEHLLQVWWSSEGDASRLLRVLRHLLSGLEKREAPATLDEPPAPRAQAPPGTATPDNQFFRVGGMWTITFGGTTVHLRDSKGLRHLQKLIRNQCKAVSIWELVLRVDTVPMASMEVADSQAVAAIRTKLKDLESVSPDDLEAMSAEEREDRVTEMRQLKSYFRAAMSGSRRAKRVQDEREKARDRVAKALRKSRADLLTHHPALAEHLKASLRTPSGFTPRYEPTDPIVWLLDA